MKEMQERLGDDPELAAAYPPPTSAYLADRDAVAAGRATCPRSRGSPPAGCPTGSSACTSSPASRWRQGRGVNPLGDEVLDAARRVVGRGPCVEPASAEPDEHREADLASRAIDCGTNSIKLLIGTSPEVVRARVADGPARAGRRHHRPARRRGAGAHLRRHRRVRRADRGPTACRPSGSASAPRRRPATPRNAEVFADGVARAARASTPRCCPARGGGAGLRRRDPRRSPASSTSRPCWSSTSAAAPPSWSSATDGPRSAARRWTSGRCGSTSGTCTPTRRRPRRSPPAWPTSTRHLDGSAGRPVGSARTVVGTSGHDQDDGVRRAGPAGVRPRRRSTAPYLGVDATRSPSSTGWWR